jgi:hypothetical protein
MCEKCSDILCQSCLRLVMLQVEAKSDLKIMSPNISRKASINDSNSLGSSIDLSQLYTKFSGVNNQ